MFPYSLKIEAGRSKPASLSPDGRGVETWRDAEGNVCAYGYVADRRHWMHFPGLATYSFSATAREVLATPAVPGIDEIIHDVYRRSVLPMVMQVQGHEVLHASAVLNGGNSIVFCGASGAGKSTIAYALSQRGYRQWADDTVALARVDGRVRTFALPFAVRLRPEPARYFGRPSKRDVALPPLHDPGGRPGKSAPLGTLFVLEQVRDEPATGNVVDVRPLSAADFFTAVLPHAYCFSLASVSRKRRMMRQYLDFGSRMRALRIRFPSDLGMLPRVLDRIEEILGRR